MFAIYLMGFAILAILSGTLSYVFIVIDLIIIAGIAFLVYYFIIGKSRVLLWTSIAFFLGLSGIAVYLYRQELLQLAVDEIIEFLKPYYYSVTVEEFYIGKFHQQLILIAIGILIFRVIVIFYNSYYLKFVPPILGGIIIFFSYLTGNFSTSKDEYAFYIFVIAVFIYYFEIYYVRLKKSEGLKKRYSFYILATVMVTIVLFVAIIVNNIYYNPFKEKTVGPGTVGSGTLASEGFEAEALHMNYSVTNEYIVQDSFEHQGIQLFKVDALKLKYYKSQTYNEFIDGRWINSMDNLIIVGEGPIEPALIAGLQQEDIFYNEVVEVIYRNILTDSIITGPFTREIDLQNKLINISIYEDGMYVADEKVGYNFTYSMTVAIPKYRKIALMEYLSKQSSDGAYSESYLSMPQGYNKLEELTDELTKDLSSNIEKAEAIEKFFKTEFIYNEAPEYETDDMINEFIFDKKQGFCQQFATSMVLMLRSQGIPSRFVSGFVINAEQFELDDIQIDARYKSEIADKYKYIYDSDAHAWVEIYIPKFGWIQYEPTPGQSVIQFSEPTDYELSLQEREELFDATKIINNEVVNIFIGIVVLVLAILVMIVLIIRSQKLKKNMKRRLMYNYRLLQLYLKAAFEGKENHETLREYARRIDRELNNIEGSFQDFVELFEKAFYNSYEPIIEEIELLEQFLNIIKVASKKNIIPLHYRRLRIIEIMTKYK